MHEAIQPAGELSPLRDPVLLAAFTGFTDAHGGAVAAVKYLAEQWDARPLATIDPERFYDFTVQRPRVACFCTPGEFRFRAQPAVGGLPSKPQFRPNFSPGSTS